MESNKFLTLRKIVSPTWMYIEDKLWKPYSADVRQQIEEAFRAGVAFLQAGNHTIGTVAELGVLLRLKLTTKQTLQAVKNASKIPQRTRKVPEGELGFAKRKAVTDLFLIRSGPLIFWRRTMKPCSTNRSDWSQFW